CLMNIIIQIDKDLKISLNAINEKVLFKPFEKVSLQVMDDDTIVIHREPDEDPFLKSIREPANSKEKFTRSDIEAMKNELWSDCR
ncbi:MAG TPA: hypothetical protein PLY78_11610, partial [Methanospirillum sp.]|nr:hypothetical protein [Methanospirillum sp.]